MINPIFIGGISLGLVLVLVGIGDFLTGRNVSSFISSTFKKVPVVGAIFSPIVVLVAMLVLGFLLGGFGIIGANIGLSTASITQQEIEASQQKCIVDYAQIHSIYLGLGGGATANYTFVEDTVDRSNYYVDTGNKTGDIANASAEINGSITLHLEPSSIPTTGSECNVVVYAVAPSYVSEDETGSDANNIWDLTDSSRVTSLLAGIQYPNRLSQVTFAQDIFLANTAVALTSPRERTTILFTAGEATDDLEFIIDIDATGIGHLVRNSPSKVIQFRQQLGTSPSVSDPVIQTLTLRKGSLDSL